jgi:2-methylcitrate dehydratase PrpD
MTLARGTFDMTGSEVSAAAGDVTTVVAKLLARPVTPDALDSARVRLADTVFAALIGLRTAQGQASTTLAESMYGKSGSLAGQLFRTVAAVRMTEIDDVDLLSCTTPGSVVIPVMLALSAHGLVADASDSGLDWVLEIIARGYDLVTGLGEAIDGPNRLAEGVWPTLAVAPVAAATIAGLALGFDDARLAQAVVLAGFTRQDGNPRGNARETMLAGSVVAGVQAALSVEQGITVTARGSEVPFAELLQATPEPGVTAAVGRAAIKHFCSARQVMTAVAAVRVLTADGQAAVGPVIVEVPPAYARMIDKPAVASRRESLASAQYQLAAALVDPARLLDVDRGDLRLDDTFRAVMDRISVRAAEDLRASYPRRWPARVRISAGGAELFEVADEAPGEGECSVPALERKFAAFAATPDALDAGVADEVIKRAVAGTAAGDLRALNCLLSSEGGRTADARVKGLPRQ